MASPSPLSSCVLDHGCPSCSVEPFVGSVDQSFALPLIRLPLLFSLPLKASHLFPPSNPHHHCRLSRCWNSSSFSSSFSPSIQPPLPQVRCQCHCRILYQEISP